MGEAQCAVGEKERTVVHAVGANRQEPSDVLCDGVVGDATEASGAHSSCNQPVAKAGVSYALGDGWVVDRLLTARRRTHQARCRGCLSQAPPPRPY